MYNVYAKMCVRVDKVYIGVYQEYGVYVKCTLCTLSVR